MVNNNLNRRKSQTVQRENKLRDIIDHFYDLFHDEQVTAAVSTAYNIGMINKKILSSMMMMRLKLRPMTHSKLQNKKI